MKRWLGLLTFIAMLLVMTTAARAADGSWSVVSSPSPAKAKNVLQAVSCASQADCWAVGQRASLPLFEHWNGTAWSAVSSPSISKGIMVGVACPSSADCWAVGASGKQENVPRMEHWDGTAWKLVPKTAFSPVPTGSFGGISCSSSTQCIAVGSLTAGSGGAWQTGYELNGSTWTSTGGGSAQGGAAVSCLSSDSCWQTDANYAVLQEWNGASWSSVSSNEPVSTVQAGISCLSESFCLNVGYIDKGELAPVAAEWNGTDWADLSAADPGSDGSLLSDVACESTSQCWAVGFVPSDGGAPREPPSSPLIETLTSSGFVEDQTSAQVPAGGALYGVTCYQSECWAVGLSAKMSLIEERTN
jgi:hypothetical protein